MPGEAEREQPFGNASLTAALLVEVRAIKTELIGLLRRLVRTSPACSPDFDASSSPSSIPIAPTQPAGTATSPPSQASKTRQPPAIS